MPIFVPINTAYMQIRPIQASDNPALAKLIRETIIEHDVPKEGTVYSDPTTDDLFSLFKTPKSIFWVAVEQTEVLGCCGIYPTPGLPEHCAELVKFYLSKHARGKGTGTALIHQSIASARDLGYTQLYLESLPQFERAVHMYSRLGFQKLEGALGNSGHTSCNLWMLKTL